MHELRLLQPNVNVLAFAIGYVPALCDERDDDVVVGLIGLPTFALDEHDDGDDGS